MIDIRENIVELLKNAAKGITDEIVFFYPPLQVNKPVITYYEAEHNTNVMLDGTPFIEEIVYQIDVWCVKLAECDELVKRIHAAFNGCGFVCLSCSDMHDETLIHKTMRFRGRLSADFVVYQ